MVTVLELLERLDQADELETANRVAAARGMSVEVLLARHGPRDERASAIVDLYVALRERGYSPARIAELTGRCSQTVHQGLKYRQDPAYQQLRKARGSKEASP